MKIVLIDADIELYRIAQQHEIEVDWGDGMITMSSDIDHAKEVLKAKVDGIIDMVGAEDYLLCISGDNNFRKKHFPTYKANRVSRKPMGYKDLKQYAIDNFKHKIVDELEADDVIGIMCTKKSKDEYIIHSEDKDMKTIPSNLWDKDKKKIVTISKLEADRNLFRQILTGDVVDGYKGCPKIGKTKADAVLAKCDSFEQLRHETLQLYIKVFKDEEIAKQEMLEQARQARILRASDYDFKNKQVILWNPWEVLDNG